MNESAHQFRDRVVSDPSEIAEVRKHIESLATRNHFSDEDVAEIGLCVNEAIANVIRHAYHGAGNKPIEIRARMNGDRLTIEIRDWGNGVVPKIREEKPDHELLTPGGLGLPCMKQLMDELEFIRQPDGMLLKMSKRKR